MISRKTMLTLAISTTLAGGVLATNANAADSFLDQAAKILSVTADNPNIHAIKEGKCGQGKCGANKGKEGKCGASKEGKCGGSK